MNNRLNVKVKELVKKDVVKIKGETLASYALEQMETTNSSSVIIVDDSGEPTGIVTLHDIVFHSSHWNDFSTIKSRDIASAPLIIISPATPFYEAFWLMNEKGVKHLAVVENGNIIGVLDDKDLLQILTEVEFLSIKRVDEIMHGGVISLPINSKISSVMKEMIEKKVSSVVIEDNNRPVGILTEKDAVRLAKIGSSSLNESVEKHMHSPVITVKANSNAIIAEKLMLKHNIRRLVVVDQEGYIVGILSQHDLMNGLSGVYVAILKQTIESLSTDLEDALRKSNFLNLTQYIVENIGLMVFFLDRDGLFTYSNNQALSTLGYKRDEMLNMSIFDIDPSVSQHSWRRTWQLSKEKKERRVESIYIKKSGEEIDVSLNINYIFHDGRELLFIISRDIGKEKRERELFRESNRVLQSFMNLSNSIFITIDRGGIITQANRKASELFESREFYKFIPESEQKKIKSKFIETLRDQKGEGELEFDILNFSGKRYSLKWRYNYSRDSSGKIEEISLSGEDITEIVELKRELEIAKTEIERLKSSLL